MAFNLSGKNAIVTGGGSGIGESISKALAGAGAQVHILELNSENGERVVNDIVTAGGSAKVHACNVVDHEAVKELITAINAAQPINILVNNAGIAHVGNIEGCNPEDLDRLYNVNIKGVYNCLHAVIPHMKQSGGGAIINMASIASSVGISDRFAYSMTKGAVLTMTYSIAKDYVQDGIRCNCISPARVHTPFVDGFISKNYPGKEEEMFDKLSRAQRGIRFKGDLSRIKVQILKLNEATGFERMLLFLQLLNDLAKWENVEFLVSEDYVNIFSQSIGLKLEKVYDYIYLNFNQEITLNKVADIACMNTSAFSRYFKKAHGENFVKYINRLRVRYACKLIVDKKLSMQEICFDSGFNNISNFNRQFKTIMNCSPSQYYELKRSKKIL